MSVQLNIKDPETVRLARELASRTGRSVTETIRTALERAIADRETETERRIADLNRIADECREALSPEMRGVTAKEMMGAIYDDRRSA